MRTVTAVAVAALFLAPGCGQMFRPDGRVASSAAAPATAGAPYLQKVGVAKEGDTPIPTAIENALVLQEKYARALEDLGREQQRTRELGDQNQKLSQNSTKLQADLAKAQQELAEANGLLMQMRGELEKWKADVLGFRDESRRVHEVELEALTKVLTLLGAEPSASAGAGEKTPAAALAKPASAAEVRQPALPEIKPATSPTAKTSAAPKAKPAPAVASSALPAEPVSVSTAPSDGKDATRDAGR